MKLSSQDEAPRGFPVGTVIDGRYRIVRFIGQGGAGLVHEVEHVRTGRRLAMKTLLDEAGFARLEQEAKATSLMRNGHAVRITDMGNAPAGVAAGPYLVMELLEGQSLRALLDDAGQLPVELTVNIALQVCECLAEAHGHNIIHRDLKPENVILASSPWPGQYDVKVLDFGVVKIAMDAPIPHSSLTRTGSTVGTPYYMSLEQLRNSSAVDARADIYALGVVMYESLSGRKPFEADTIGDLVYAICSKPPTHLSRLRPDAPAEVCQVVMRALATNREERQASMREIAATLLPYGNAAFGLWLRAEPRRPEPGRGSMASLASAGGRDAAEAPAGAWRDAGDPPRPAAGAPPRPAGAPRPAAGVEASSARVAAPAGISMRDDAEGAAASGQRDTPTEMYAKEQGGAHEPVPDRDTPTRALERAQPADPGDTLTIRQVPRAEIENMESYGAFSSSPTVPAPQTGVPLPPMQATVRLRSPEPSSPGLPLAIPAPEKPGWQRSLDSALVRVGGGIERAVRGGAAAFRNAPPQAQLVVTVAGASLVTAILVLSLYLLLK